MKVKSLLCLCLFLLVSPSVFSQSAKRPITVNDFFKLKSVRNPQISPDGRWVAYTVSEMDLKTDKSETRIWMVRSTGGKPIPMTAKGYSAGSPRWSPDGKYLSFIASRSKGKKSQVWSLNRMGGEAQQVTKVKQGVSGFSWSPDGKRMFLMIRDAKPEDLVEGKKEKPKPKPYVIDRLQFKRDYAGYLDRRRTHIYTFTPGSKKDPVQITSGDYDEGQAVWSPDGKSIAFVSNRTVEPDSNPNSDIWIVSADNTDKGQTLLQVTKNPREDSSPAWSPDGKTLTYVTINAPLKVLWYATNKLATISASGGEPTYLTPNLDRNVRQPRFSADGKSVWFRLEDSGEQHLASIDVQSKKLTRPVSGNVNVQSYALQGRLIVPLLTKADTPSELFTLRGGQLKPLTSTNKKLIDQLKITAVENIHFKSKDGTEIEGFLYKPIGYRKGTKYPTILRIHGGPVGQYSFAFNFWAQLYAANGYLVVETNPRGSSGYGQAFSHALFADWGNLDFQDVNAGVDYAIEKGLADPDKLGVGGWSYGGILTNYVITKTGRFKGAVSGASEANFRANYGHDHYQMWWEVELGLPWENAAAWERISPFNDVGKITTPTLWIGGQLDWNVPILNSEQMYQAMKRLGIETQLVVYPGEHHGIRRPTFQKDRFERFVGWYDKYVKGKKPGKKKKSKKRKREVASN